MQISSLYLIGFVYWPYIFKNIFKILLSFCYLSLLKEKNARNGNDEECIKSEVSILSLSSVLELEIFNHVYFLLLLLASSKILNLKFVSSDLKIFDSITWFWVVEKEQSNLHKSYLSPPEFC